MKIFIKKIDEVEDKIMNDPQISNEDYKQKPLIKDKIKNDPQKL